MKYSPPYSRVHWSSQIWSLAVKHWGRKEGLRNRKKSPEKRLSSRYVMGPASVLGCFYISSTDVSNLHEFSTNQANTYTRYIFLRSLPLFSILLISACFLGIFADLKNLIVTFHKIFPLVCIKKDRKFKLDCVRIINSYAIWKCQVF